MSKWQDVIYKGKNIQNVIALRMKLPLILAPLFICIVHPVKVGALKFAAL